MNSILHTIRRSRLSKTVSLAMAASFVAEVFYPTAAFALTSGPSQPEYGSFTPVETTEMVDLYSGDFSYNIPLLSVPGPNGGYPINLGYTSNIGMDEEASWVGLGWNINVGAINRNLRGLPDDFKGKIIEEEVHIKPEWTIGIDFPQAGSSEAWGIPTGGAGPSVSLYYNSSRGIGYSITQGLPIGKSGSLGVNFSFDSQGGLDVNPSLTLGKNFKKAGFSFGFGASINSRSGFQGFSFTGGVSGGGEVTGKRTKRDRINGQGAENVEKMNVGLKSTLSFNPNYSSPGTTMPMINKRFDLDFKFPPMAKVDVLGRYNYGIFFGANAFFDITKVADGGIINTPAYGYINTPNATDDPKAMKDYLRSPIPYSKEVPLLGTSMPTYDLFTISGQGAGGMFRAHLGNIGTLQEPGRKSEQDGHRFNLEVPIPSSYFYVGVGYTNRSGYTSSGSWHKQGDYDSLSSNLNYAPIGGASNIKEDVYFKGYGEKTADLLVENVGGQHQNQYDLWSGNAPSKADYERSGNFVGQQWIMNGEVENIDFNYGLTKSIDERVSRSTNFRILTRSQSKLYGYSSDSSLYRFYDGVTPKRISEICVTGCDDDIHEIQVLQPDGTTYVYGLPAYNWTQVEATFSVTGQTVDPTIPNRIDLPANRYSDKGNQYYSKKTIPAYPHSWLLTGIIGPDYVDRSNNGISDDDFGYWVNFTYERKNDHYRWRAPYTKANYMEGALGDVLTTGAGKDDIGSYLYGEKDVYYIKEVQTKTHIALFFVSGRSDSKSAQGELAITPGTDSLYKLDSIELYTRADYDVNGNNATSLKTVVFEYEYSLCEGVENSSSGKLTLKKVFFRYNNSNRGSLSPYVFHYEESSALHNPDYNTLNIDRWGNYKYNLEASGQGLHSGYPFFRFPYTNQWDYNGDGIEDSNDVEMRNAHASAWHLKKITLPTGGIIKIEYEQDDYAYVEGKHAMQMFDIVGVGSSLTDPALPGEGIENGNIGGLEKKRRVYVRLPEKIADNTLYQGYAISDADVGAQYFKDHYLRDIEDIYFKALITMPKDGFPSQAKDYVSGYASLETLGNDPSDNFGLIEIGNSGFYEYAYFDLAGEAVNFKAAAGLAQVPLLVHPFTKAAWYYVRGSRPDLLRAGPTDQATPMDQVLGFMHSITDFLTNDLQQLSMGYESFCVFKGFSKVIALNGNSIVRLYNPHGKKYGGGSRVKRITLSDEWGTMNAANGGTNSEYGQEYDYTTIEDGLTISSGVAYEPSAGGEESALRNPIHYVNKMLFKTDENLFLETPIMEEFYPSPSVGYSKVTVKSLGRDYEHGGAVQSDETYAPYTVHEFYTPKEFPVITHYTPIDQNTIKRPLNLIVYSQNIIRKIASQGVSVVLNDMAGKVKSVTKYTTPATLKESNLLYKEEYVYKTLEPDYAPNISGKKTYELDCKVTAVLPDSTYRQAYMGQSHDFYVELHEDFNLTKTKGVDVNIIGLIAPPVLPVLPIPIPTFSKGENSLKTAVTHKIIYKTGILERTIVTDEKARIETQNLAFDALTGQPVLTRTTNEFRDSIYALNYPAHWYYEGMGGAYRNIGYKVENKNHAGNGWITLNPNEVAHFMVGDEVLVGSEVYNVYEKSGSGVRLIDKAGTFFTHLMAASMEVVRSGHRNLLTALAGSTVMQSIVFDTDSLGNLLSDIDESNKIINTSAVEYGDDWQLLCGGINASEAINETVCSYTTAATELFNIIRNTIMPHIAASNPSGNFSLCNISPPVSALIPQGCCSLGSDLFIGYSISSDNNIMYLNITGCISRCSMTAVLDTSHNWNDVSNIYLPNLTGNVSNPSKLSFNYRINGSTTIESGTITLSSYMATIPLQSACPEFYSCHDVVTVDFDICPSDDYFNPFKQAVKGIWRPIKSYAYHEERSYTTDNVRTDGHYKNFSPFNWINTTLNDPKRWVCANTITKISPYSYELENKDALGIYSAALYGYDNSLVTAVAANARYNEIAFDGFEDYGFGLDENLCGSGHWDFRPVSGFTTNYLSDAQAHTGKYSCALTAAFPSIEIVSDAIPANYCATYTTGGSTLANSTGYVGNACQCIGKHAFIQQRKYLVSAWVKQSSTTGYLGLNPAIKNKGVVATVTYINGSGTVISSDQITISNPHHINGWSKLEGTFTVPAGAVKVALMFRDNNSSSSSACYIDDIRIQPFNSEMKTFVYNPLSLRLMAELDGQNYATFYLYDEEGNLVKINKETVDGIRTLTESRMHTVPTNN